MKALKIDWSRTLPYQLNTKCNANDQAISSGQLGKTS